MRAANRLAPVDEAVLEVAKRGQTWAFAHGMSGEVPPPTRL